MELSDFMLMARVNLALARDPRVTSLDIGVRAEGGTIYLQGDVDTEQEARAIEEITEKVEGVRRICSDLAVGAGAWAGQADLITEMLLQKLETEWAQLPQHTAIIECDYMRWALWLVHKFHFPREVETTDRCAQESEAKERALCQLSGYLKVPGNVLAWIMHQQADRFSDQQPTDAPVIENLPLSPSPARTAA